MTPDEATKKAISHINQTGKTIKSNWYAGITHDFKERLQDHRNHGCNPDLEDKWVLNSKEDAQKAENMLGEKGLKTNPGGGNVQSKTLYVFYDPNMNH